MPRQRVPLTARQWAAVALLLALLLAQVAANLASGPLWLTMSLAVLTTIALVVCALVVVAPLIWGKDQAS